MVIERTEKKCPGCERTLRIERFNIDSGRGDGHDSMCRDCRHAAKKKTVEKNKAFWSRKHTIIPEPEQAPETSSGDMERHNDGVGDMEI